MKKITTITFQNAYNYGATLQCYALQKKLLEMGYDVSVLNYDNPRIGNRYKTIYLSDIREGKKKFIKNLVYSTIYFRKRYDKAHNFKKFIKNNIALTPKYKCTKIKKGIIKTDCYITGSDQVWNPNITKGFDDIYTLNFESTAKKISYAASIGESKLIKEYSNIYKKTIENIDYVSVRENDARIELGKISNKDIEVAIDPTLLLQKEEWDNLIQDRPNCITEKYICAYVVELDREYIKIVNELSKRTGLKVVHFGLKNPGYINVLENVYAKDPIDFINIIKNAEYIVTTSFHATVFSTLYNKDFFVIPHRKTGVRVSDLLRKLGMNNRIYNSYEEFSKIKIEKVKTEWNDVKKQLDIERKKSINWLESAIEGE